MKRVEKVRAGYYFTNGEKIIQVVNELPNRPDTYLVLTEDDEEIKIKKDKLYKVRINENWLDDFGFKTESHIFKDPELEVYLKKSGPAYQIEEHDLKTNSKKRRMILSVDEFQDYMYKVTNEVPKK